MSRPSECPKCQSSMSEGFVVDHTYGGSDVASWVKGTPERSIWVGLKLGGKETFKITTWRCNRCGYLETTPQADCQETLQGSLGGRDSQFLSVPNVYPKSVTMSSEKCRMG